MPSRSGSRPRQRAGAASNTPPAAPRMLLRPTSSNSTTRAAARPPSSSVPRTVVAPPPPQSNASGEKATSTIHELIQFGKPQLVFNQPSRTNASHHPATVIGTIGRQGVGKSSLLSKLRNVVLQNGSTTKVLNEKYTSTQSLQMNSDEMLSSLVTLDSPPVFSLSALATLIENEKDSRNFVSLWTAAELEEIQSLQLAVYLLAACDIILVVQDQLYDEDIYKMLLRAEMILAGIPVLSSAAAVAKIVVVLNNVDIPTSFANNDLEIEAAMSAISAKFQNSECARTPITKSFLCNEKLAIFKKSVPYVIVPSGKTNVDDFEVSFQKLMQELGNCSERKRSVKEWIKDSSVIFEAVINSATFKNFGRALQRV